MFATIKYSQPPEKHSITDSGKLWRPESPIFCGKQTLHRASEAQLPAYDNLNEQTDLLISLLTRLATYAAYFVILVLSTPSLKYLLSDVGYQSSLPKPGPKRIKNMPIAISTC